MVSLRGPALATVIELGGDGDPMGSVSFSSGGIDLDVTATRLGQNLLKQGRRCWEGTI